MHVRGGVPKALTLKVSREGYADQTGVKKGKSKEMKHRQLCHRVCRAEVRRCTGAPKKPKAG